MSIRLMTIAWSVPWPSQSALLIALKLADHADDDGASIHPSRSKLAKHALTSLATVRRTLAGFRDVGLLEVVAAGGKGPKSTTVYRMNLSLLMKLHDGYLELQRAENVEDGFVLVAKEPVDSCGKEEGHSDPLKSVSGSRDVLSGSQEKLSGSIGGPRTTTLEPSSRTLSADSNFDLNKCRVWPALEITPDNASSWKSWISHLTDVGMNGLADRATASGRMTVACRYPGEGVPLPVVPRATLTERSLAMTGEAQ